MIDIAIVNYNTREHLRACLESLVTEPARQVVVVDNASTDGSPAMVRADYPQVQLTVNQTNPGYGVGANQAIAQGRSPYVVLLNSDTRVVPGALQALEAYLDVHPRAAVVGPRLLNPDGSEQASCYSFPTPLHIFLEETTLIRLIRATPVLREWFPRTQTRHRSRRVDWVLGAVLAVRREAFDAVGGFDETFFMYAEEVDLSYRLRQAGWETHFASEAAVVHVGGASTQQRRAAMAEQYFLSLLRFYRRHYSPARQALLQVMLKAIVALRWVRDTVKLKLLKRPGQRAALAEDLAGWRQILRSRPGSEQTSG